MKQLRFKGIAKLLIILTSLTIGNAEFPEEKATRVESALTSPKILPNLKAKLMESNQAFNILIEFSGGNRKALKEFRNDPLSRREDVTRGVKLSALVDKLERHAHTSQANVVEFLQFRNVTFQQFWIDNHLHVKGVDTSIIGELAIKFGEIERIWEPAPVKPPKRIQATAIPEPPAEGESPWPILQMRARCDEIDCLGEGVVIGTFDPEGYLYTHEQLRDNWREDHGWFDPIEGSLLPRSPGMHGTFCTSCAVGKTLGVAPKAQWIACIPEDEATVRACGQWTICPTNPDGSDRDCSYAPDILTNSWAFDRQGVSRLSLYDLILAFHEAGIINFQAAGNEGPACNTVEHPALYDINFAVGAIDSVSAPAWFTSLGPALNFAHINPNSTSGSCTAEVQPDDAIQGIERGWGEESGTICLLTKPEISAPGYNINSSDTASDTAYVVASGTSASTPYVAGIAALMICANNKAGKPPLGWETIANILKETASTERISLNNPNDTNAPTIGNIGRTSHRLCDIGYGNCNSFPNNIYGWGEVDACKAVRKVKSRY